MLTMRDSRPGGQSEDLSPTPGSDLDWGTGISGSSGFLQFVAV